MARPERFELPTARFVAEYSIQLSYGRIVFLRGLMPLWVQGPLLQIHMAERESAYIASKGFLYCL